MVSWRHLNKSFSCFELVTVMTVGLDSLLANCFSIHSIASNPFIWGKARSTLLSEHWF